MTEAERIEKDAEEFVSGDAIFQCPPDRVLLTCYIAGATAENERLHQQIKEKSDKIAKITLFSRMYQTDIEFLKEELKSAQELNRELVGKLKKVKEYLFFTEGFSPIGNEIEELITRAE